jgi:LEA14-like dessication related protein
MASPNSRQGLIEYCLRKLGKPVLEINVDDDQIGDLVDDALQYFHERHFDGIERVYLKHQLNAEEKSIIRSGIQTSVGTSGIGVTNVSFQETTNFLALPDTIIGINNVFKVDSSTISSGLFNIKYQIFLNDLYYYGALDLLNYAMVKTHLEDISRILTPDVQLRFNKKQHRLYLDIDWKQVDDDTWIIMDCYRIVNPNDFPKIYNDYWLKRYLTALIKKQWGQNMIKFTGVQLPGGITLNGRQLYEDAVRELDEIERLLKTEYELPPMDMIG